MYSLMVPNKHVPPNTPTRITKQAATFLCCYFLEISMQFRYFTDFLKFDESICDEIHLYDFFMKAQNFSMYWKIFSTTRKDKCR